MKIKGAKELRKRFLLRPWGIYPKLVVTFLLAVVPMYLISLQMNQMGARSVKQEILASMGTRVHFYLNMFEAETQRTLRLQKQFVVDEDIQMISTITPDTRFYDVYENLLSQQRVQNKLLIMENSSLYIDQARVYIPKLSKVFLSDSVQNGILRQELEEFSRLGNNPVPIIGYSDGRLVLRSKPPEPANSRATPDFVIEAEISKYAVGQFLSKITYRKNEGIFLMDDQGQWYIGNQRDDAMIKPLSATLARNRIAASNQLNIRVNGEVYLVSYERSPVLGATLVVYVPEAEILGPLYRYHDWLWLLSVLSFLVIILFSYWIYRVIHRPLRTLVLALRRVEKGDWTSAIRHRVRDEFQYVYKQFNSMVRQVKELIEENYKSRILAQQLELKQLQSQINPHFLYNTYFMVHRMAESQDLDNVQRATKYLGQYFMYITRSASDEVTLEEEYGHMANYAHIQTMRFSHRIRTVIGDIPPGCSDIRIPRLILQPLLENAYVHGLKSKVSGGLAEVSVTETDDRVVIRIEDNGDEFGDEALSRVLELLNGRRTAKETTGLVNVHNRLKLRYGESFGLAVTRGSLGGMKVEMAIPKKNEGGKAHVPLADYR
jgi:two-component system sensor histidine kinase YesM